MADGFWETAKLACGDLQIEATESWRANHLNTKFYGTADW